MKSIPEISARGSLILWAKCQIPVGPRPCVGPRSGREGEKCQALDHMRQIPFIHQLRPFTSHSNINFYIYLKLFHLFFPYGIYMGTWYGIHFFIYACTLPYSTCSCLFKYGIHICARAFSKIRELSAVSWSIIDCLKRKVQKINVSRAKNMRHPTITQIKNKSKWPMRRMCFRWKIQ